MIKTRVRKLFIILAIALGGTTSPSAADERMQEVREFLRLSQQFSANGANMSAYQYASRAYNMSADVFGETSENHGHILLYMVDTAISAYREKGTDAFMLRNLPLIIDIFGERSPEHVKALKQLGHLHLPSGKRKKSIKFYEQALAIQEEELGANSRGIAQSYLEISQRVLLRDGGSTYGRSIFKKSLSILQSIDTDEARSDLHNALLWEAKISLSKRQYKKVIEQIEALLARMNTGEQASVFGLSARRFLVKALDERGKDDEVLAQIEKIIELRGENKNARAALIFMAILDRSKYQSTSSRNTKGKVTVVYDIDKKGHPINITVERSDVNKTLERATIDMVERSRYVPGVVNGKMVWSSGYRYTMNWGK